MTESYVSVAGGQSGDKLRTSKKTYSGLEVHEQYVVPDVSWTIRGSYYWSGSFVGFATINGILAAILRPSAAGNFDIIIRRVMINWYNDTGGATNRFTLQRTTGMPGANVADSLSTLGLKDSSYPAATARTYIKPTGITLGSEPTSTINGKNATVGDMGTNLTEFLDPNSPFLLTSGQALCVVQTPNAGSSAESWQIAFDWHEVSVL